MRVRLEDIIIPEYYVRPDKEKLKGKLNYFWKYNKFASPLIIDENNNLLDGYTSYCIAQKLNMEYVGVEVR